jgi:hypothetical protein
MNMQNLLRKLVMGSSLFWTVTNAFAQGGAVNADNFQKMVDFLPPAPNAAAIVKYGAVSLNKNTGAPNITIPLFTLKGHKTAVDVSLNYSSTGIKVDEIASRTGMGWVLKAGGVITRTVRGWADETHTRKEPWAAIDMNWQTFQFMKEVSDATFYNGVDAEPDLFSFNFPGGSGSFIFGGGMTIVQNPVSNYKIYYNFSSTDWNFKIVSASGTEYQFGGTDRVEKTKRISNCAKSFDDYITTAWYLKKIIGQNGDVIEFSYQPLNYQYETGLSQSMTYDWPIKEIEGPLDCFPQTPCSNNAIANTSPTCINKTLTQGVVLKEILCYPTNQKIHINYTDRQDCSDMLVSTIALTDINTATATKQFSFGYNTVTSSGAYQGETEYGVDKTPYLTTLTESGGASSLTHNFVYNDAAARPKRLSYSQDHWGYFNGKNNSNLLPKPMNTDPFYISRFPNANANREADAVYASKGMLSKIAYPTGGIDTIIYESNKYGASNTINLLHTFSCDVTGPAFNTEATRTHGFGIQGQSQIIDLSVVVTTPDPNGFYDPIHDLGRVQSFLTGYICAKICTVIWRFLFHTYFQSKGQWNKNRCRA